MRRFAAGLLILVSSLCLFLSSTSLWVRHNVINTGVFVSNVETIVDLPPVQSRVTDQVTTTVMTNPRVTDAIDSAMSVLPPGLQQFKPTVTNGIRNLVSTGVSRLLAAQPFRPLTEAAITTAHQQLVNGQPVEFTLGQAKARVPASARTGLAGQVLNLLPDNLGITLITPADAPRLYNAIDLLKSLWWWVGLIGLATLAGALGISRRRWGTLRAWSITTAVLAFVTLIILRVARGSVLVQVKAENRDAVGAVYDVLAGSLRSWTLWLLAIALFILAETLVWGHLGLVSGVRHAYRSARESVQRHRADRALAAQAAAAERAAGGEPSPEVEEAAADLPWTRRVAIGTRAFADSLELSQRSARLGGYVREHFDAARWTGIVLGVFVLLIWPSPTLSVLIWIAAIVALWIGALVWLRAQAPEEERPEAVLPAGAVAVAEAPVAPAGVPAVPQARAPTNGIPSQSPASPPEVISGLTDRMDLLVRLGQAHDSGLLTDEEFEREKSRLLAV